MVAVGASAFKGSGFPCLSALLFLVWFPSFGSLQVPQSGLGSYSSHHTQGPGIKEEEEGRAEKHLVPALAALNEFP